jgi:TRAP-type C4-dicarboxylate transport system substrate-binding protein
VDEGSEEIQVKEVRMIKRLSKMSWMVLVILLSLALVVLPACGGGEEEEEITGYTLTMSSTAGGSVTPATGTHSYPQGTVVDLAANAAAGYRFVSWTGAPVADANDPTTTITMNGDHSIVANFEKVEVPVTTIRAATYFGPTTDQCVMLDAFCNDLEAQSNGALETLRYWGGTLASGGALYEGAAAGTIDIIFTALLYNGGRFPPMDVFALPLGIPSAYVGSHVVQDLYAEYGGKGNFTQFNDTHPLFFSLSAPLVMYTTSAVRTKADLSGKVIRTGTPNNCILTSLGAGTDNRGMPLVWDAVYKGQLNGVMIGCDGYSSWNLHQVAKYCTFPYVAGGDVFLATMSNKCWNSLTPELQAVVNNVAAIYTSKVCTMWTTANANGLQIGKGAGVEFICLSAAERDSWLAALNGCYGTWTNTMIGKGYTNSTIQDWINYTKTRITYWTANQTTSGPAFNFGYPSCS